MARRKVRWFPRTGKGWAAVVLILGIGVGLLALVPSKPAPTWTGEAVAFVTPHSLGPNGASDWTAAVVVVVPGFDPKSCTMLSPAVPAAGEFGGIKPTPHKADHYALNYLWHGPPVLTAELEHFKAKCTG